MIFFWCFIGFVILQRLVELYIARRNLKMMFGKGAVELDRGGYKYIVLMHIAFFLSLILEKEFLKPDVNKYSILLIGIFILAQLLRYWSLVSLGTFWNTRILVLSNSKLVKRGPYKYFPHPNYAAVITEIAVIPLIFSCYITAVVFSALNFFALVRRIRIESDAIKELDNN